MNVMDRIVHLDCKGATPGIPYIEKLLIGFKSWGATGVLLEWEDTFPYMWQLIEFGSQFGCGGDGHYLKDEIKHILRFSKNLGLKAIQLVQTIGHMEYVLKHPNFQRMREARQSPSSICPSNPDTLMLVEGMLKQVLDAQPNAEYVHIGADEVWHLGVCADCQKRASVNEHGVASLYLEHIQEVALYLKRNYPRVTILMWDDMLRNISADVLREYDLGTLVQPVVWNYNIKEFFNIPPHLWDNYRQVFPVVWAASAYRGANGSCQILSPVNRYVSNQEAWIEEIKKESPKTTFAGIILTGWSRYDHYATLCELLPVAMPSLASCLRLLTKDDSIPKEAVVCETLPSDQWPAENVARGVHTLVLLRQRAYGFIYGDQVSTWMNPWQIANCYTNPTQVSVIALNAKQLVTEFETLYAEIKPGLYSIAGRRSVDEWLHTYLFPLMNRLIELLKIAESRSEVDASIIPKNMPYLWIKNLQQQ